MNDDHAGNAQAESSGKGGRNWRDLWRSCVLNGEAENVSTMLREISAADDFLDPAGPAPLIGIARQTPRDKDHEAGLVETARILIAHGASLNTPDLRGLYPADYALMGASRAVAREIVLSTLRQDALAGCASPYRPNFKRMFKILVAQDEREAAHRNLGANLACVSAALTDLLDRDAYLAEELGHEIDYWSGVTAPPLNFLAMPSRALCDHFERLTELKNQSAPPNPDGIAVAEEIRRALEWAANRRIQPA